MKRVESAAGEPVKQVEPAASEPPWNIALRKEAPLDAGFGCRPRTARDLQACATLLETVFRADGYPEVWPSDPGAWIDSERTIAAWVACAQAIVVGHVAVASVDAREQRHYLSATGRPAPQLLELKRLFVHPGQRRAGITDRLHDTAVAYARARNLQPVLETMDGNERAIRFYERRGWRRIGTTLARWHTASGDRPLMILFTLSD